MLIAGFSKKEIKDCAKQAWIYRRCDKADSAADVPPPESIVLTELAGGEGATTISSISLLSPSNRVSPEEDKQQVTEPNTLARQQALANARMHGGWFHASGGGTHLTSDDIFIAAEISTRAKERDDLAR